MSSITEKRFYTRDGNSELDPFYLEDEKEGWEELIEAARGMTRKEIEELKFDFSADPKHFNSLVSLSLCFLKVATPDENPSLISDELCEQAHAGVYKKLSAAQLEKMETKYKPYTYNSIREVENEPYFIPVWAWRNFRFKTFCIGDLALATARGRHRPLTRPKALRAGEKLEKKAKKNETTAYLKQFITRNMKEK